MAQNPYLMGYEPADPLVSPDFSGWWRRSFALIHATWKPMVIIQAVVAVPTLVVLLPAMIIFQEKQREVLDSTDPDFWQFFAGLSVLLPAAAVAGLFYLLGQLACQQVVVFRATGRPGNLVGPALLAGAKRVPALIGWCLLAVPVLIVATVLCFFPVLYVGAVLTILPAVVLLERGNGIGRCFQLFHANFAVSASRIATIIGLSFAAGTLLTLLTTIVDVTIGGSSSTPNTTATVINAVLQGGYYIVSYVVLAGLLVPAYADMRARLEPFTTADLLPAQRSSGSRP
jgi:hypothetical protein